MAFRRLRNTCAKIYWIHVYVLFMEVKHTYQNLKGLACIPNVVQLPFGRRWLLVRAVHRWSFHRWSFLSKKGAGPGTASSTCKVATTTQIFNPWIILAISGITMVASGQKSSASTWSSVRHGKVRTTGHVKQQKKQVRALPYLGPQTTCDNTEIFNNFVKPRKWILLERNHSQNTPKHFSCVCWNLHLYVT